MNLLQEVEKQIYNEFELLNNVKMNSVQVINQAFNIIKKLHEVHNKSLKANKIIINKLQNIDKMLKI